MNPPHTSSRAPAARPREAARRLRELGFACAALDPEGYRMGSVNEVLPGSEAPWTKGEGGK